MVKKTTFLIVFFAALTTNLVRVGEVVADANLKVAMVKDIREIGSESSYPEYLTEVNGMLYFVATSDTYGRELWKTDGTQAGTVIVKDIDPGSVDRDGEPVRLTEMDGILYFSASDFINGRELWRSDGTELGTFMVKDIYFGQHGSLPKEMTAVNGILYFSADDGVYSTELWKSDGTEAGTTMVKDIKAGSGVLGGSYPDDLTDVNGALYFTADDGARTRAMEE